MDVKYLGNRYDRGVQRVKSFMEQHHRYVHVQNLPDALPDFLEHLGKLGGASPVCLAWHWCFQRDVPELFNMTCIIFGIQLAILRYVIVIIDATVWPKRNLAQNLIFFGGSSCKITLNRAMFSDRLSNCKSRTHHAG